MLKTNTDDMTEPDVVPKSVVKSSDLMSVDDQKEPVFTIDLQKQRNFDITPIQTKQNRATFIIRSPQKVDNSPVRPTLNIEQDRLTELNSHAPLRADSKDKDFNKPFAYPDMNLAQVTKNRKFRDLYADHFENAKMATQTWKPHVENRIEHENKKINKFKDTVEFIDLKMETAIRISYDHNRTLDENLEEYK